MKTLLAVDVGGTKADLALYDLESQDFTPKRRQVYPCAQYTGIEEIVGVFLAEGTLQPDFACLGVAGIVANNEARITNLPWVLSEGELAEKFAISGVRLINDMTALCASLSTLATDDLLPLQDRQAEKEGVRAVIAPGTGLGQGYLIETETTFLPRGSEGGHCDFAPVDDEQQELLRWLGRKSRPVSYEMLCSGLGIPTLYDFCREQGHIRETREIREQLEGVRDRTPVIVGGAIAEVPCPLCRKAMELFLSILGSEAGNLALKLYASGGLYIGGGIMPRLVGKIPFTPFLAAFCRKEKMEHLMERIPVKLILRPDAVLFGAAVFGRRYFHSSSG